MFPIKNVGKENIIDKIKFTYGSDCMILILFCLFLLLSFLIWKKKSHFAVLVDVFCTPEDAGTQVNWVIFCISQFLVHVNSAM